MRKSGFALFAVAVVACSDLTSPVPRLTPQALAVRPAILINETTPSALVTPNPCNGDAVALTGTTHLVIGYTESNGGNQSFYFDITGQYSGVGAPSLVSYRGYFNQHHTTMLSSPYPIVDTFFDEIKVTAATNELNYTIRLHAKITINANGTATAEFLDTTSRCDGKDGFIPGVTLPPVAQGVPPRGLPGGTAARR